MNNKYVYCKYMLGLVYSMLNFKCQLSIYSFTYSIARKQPDTL